MITSTTVITDLIISGAPSALDFAKSVSGSDFYAGFVIFVSTLLIAPIVAYAYSKIVAW